MGVGYNPYRKANGEFASRDEVEAQASSDLAVAIKDGDTERQIMIEDFIIDNFEESKEAQNILQTRYMEDAMKGKTFKSRQEKDKAYEESVRKGHEEKLKKRGKYELSPQERSLRLKEIAENQEKVKERSENDDIVFEDANPERAERRLKEAIEFAKERNNINLVRKLSNAKVLPSGAFKTADGKRVNTDQVLKNHLISNAYDENKKKATEELQNRLSDEPVGTKVSVRTDAGLFTATVKEDIDNYAYDALTDDVKESISSEKVSFDASLAYEKLPREKYLAITKESLVNDYVTGKKELDGFSPFTTSGKPGLKGALEDISDFYGENRKKIGAHRDVKKERQAGTDAIKAKSSEYGGNVFVPARSQSNGVVFSTRRYIDEKSADELLTDDEKKFISKVKMVPDREKAEKVLSKKDFDKIYVRKVSLGARESK